MTRLSFPNRYIVAALGLALLGSVSAWGAGSAWASKPVEPTAGALGDCYAGCHGVTCCCCAAPSWYSQADALMLDRCRVREIKIVELGTGTPPRGQRDALMTTDAIDPDPAWGPRITLGHNLTECRQVELTYFGQHYWSPSAAYDAVNAPTVGNIDVPFNANIFSDWDGAQYVSAFYASKLHNVELNLRTSDRWDLNRSTGYPWYYYADFLAGFRYLRLSEEFDLRSTDAGDTSDYMIDTTNDLVGLQIGAITGTHVSPRLSWNVAGKAGLYTNFARQSTLLRDDGNTVLFRDFSNRSEELAFVGELGINVACELHQNVALVAGYFLLWVDGVALAPEQLDFTTTSTSGSGLNTGGTAFYNGTFAGFRVVH